MSTASTAQALHLHDLDEADELDEAEDDEEEAGGVILSPDEEAMLVEAMADLDECEKAGTMIPWSKIRAERGM